MYNKIVFYYLKKECSVVLLVIIVVIIKLPLLFKFKFKFIYSHLFNYNATTIIKKRSKNRANYTLN